MRTRHSSLAALSSIFFFTAFSYAADSQYYVIEIGPGYSGFLNSSGQVAVNDSTTYLWTNGTIQNITNPAGNSFFAKSINDSGVVAGFSNGQAVVWQNGNMSNL